MGNGYVTPSGQLPNYNIGNSPGMNAPPQTGTGAFPGGSFYTPKFGMPTYIGAYQPQSDVSFMNSVPQLLQGAQGMQNMLGQWNPLFQNPAMMQPTNYSPALTTAYGEGMSAQEYPYIQQALQTGFDPQNALYARTAGLLTDQTRAAEAAQGVAGTPYGAGVEAQNMADFNLKWVQQEQQRQQAAASIASSLGQDVGAGQQLAQAGPSFQTSILSSLMGNQVQAMSPIQIAASDYLSYLGHNQQATLNASQQNIASVSTLLDFIQATSDGGGGGGGKSGGSSGAGQIGSMLGGKGAMGGK